MVGTTVHPEAVLARELGMCCTPLCLVTDLDAGAQSGEGVTREEVLAAFATNLERLRHLLQLHTPVRRLASPPCWADQPLVLQSLRRARCSTRRMGTAVQTVHTLLTCAYSQ